MICIWKTKIIQVLHRKIAPKFGVKKRRKPILQVWIWGIKGNQNFPKNPSWGLWKL